MNTNQISVDRFSNPATEALFRAGWTESRITEEHADQLSCGYCHFGWCVNRPPGRDWMLCLNPSSPHEYETVAGMFSCPNQVHG
jgi:hypothetical protein